MYGFNQPSAPNPKPEQKPEQSRTISLKKALAIGAVPLLLLFGAAFQNPSLTAQLNTVLSEISDLKAQNIALEAKVDSLAVKGLASSTRRQLFTTAQTRTRLVPRATTWPRCGRFATPRTCATTRFSGSPKRIRVPARPVLSSAGFALGPSLRLLALPGRLIAMGGHQVTQPIEEPLFCSLMTGASSEPLPARGMVRRTPAPLPSTSGACRTEEENDTALPVTADVALPTVAAGFDHGNAASIRHKIVGEPLSIVPCSQKFC